MTKDSLARGAKSAQFAGGVGESDPLRNVWKGSTEETATPDVQAPSKSTVLKRFRPIGNVLLVRPMTAEEKVAESGNLVISTELAQERPAEGVVLEIGKEATEVVKGEHITFGKYAGTEFKLNGEILLLMRIEDVLGIVEDTSEVAIDLGVGGCVVGRA